MRNFNRILVPVLFLGCLWGLYNFFTGQQPNQIDRQLLEQHAVSVDAIKAMSESYNTDSAKSFVLNKLNPYTIKDGSAVTFDIDLLESIINDIKDRCRKNGVDPEIKLGIKFYFVKYPNDFTVPPYSAGGIKNPDQNYKNKHSLVMVSAYQRPKSQVWLDYDYLTSTSQNQFPRFDTTQSNKPLNNKTGGYNNGTMSPPPYQGAFPSSDE